jgi:hypothetical protein
MVKIESARRHCMKNFMVGASNEGVKLDVQSRDKRELNGVEISK